MGNFTENINKGKRVLTPPPIRLLPTRDPHLFDGKCATVALGPYSLFWKTLLNYKLLINVVTMVSKNLNSTWVQLYPSP